MGEKQSIVVGSGAGGLTLALLLARAGRRVTLLEIQPEIGGYLRRFSRGGIRFDTGYHFSGGFTNVMAQLMHLLGLEEANRAEPIYNRIVLRESGNDMTIPARSGFRGTEEVLSGHFRDDASALHSLFDAIAEVWRDTPMRDLSDLSLPRMEISRFDMQTVGDFCGSVGLGRAAAAAAGSFAMCHGSLPAEAAMSFHARVGYAIFDDLARPVEGGDPMISAFRRRAEELGITIRTGTTLRRFGEPDPDGACHTAVLSDGSAVDADQVFFTIHPRSAAELLPEQTMTPSLCRRIRRMHETTSFFCSYYTVDESVPFTPGLVSFFSSNDLDAILRGEGPYSTGYLLGREKGADGKTHATVAAFRTMPPGAPETAPGSRRERRSDSGYRELKTRMASEIADDLAEVCPEFKGHLRLAETGTPLTCRDYDPPTGSAYGVRGVCGQSRLCGRLPVRNFFIAGQSALVPGVMGTMLASLTVFRQAVGEETYGRVIRESGLC
ncbi:MAG: FAD-dependent oxidoreductase [Lentisphaeria bacterium]|nr:FAD-dependent oxidoreductase [Lentisphaeria bacterium]